MLPKHCPSHNRLVQRQYRLRKGCKGESKNFHYCSSCLAELSATAKIFLQEEHKTNREYLAHFKLLPIKKILVIFTPVREFFAVTTCMCI